MEKRKPGLYDVNSAMVVADWMVDSGALGSAHEQTSFYVQYRHEEKINKFLRFVFKLLFPKPTLHLVTTRPGYFIGQSGLRLKEYYQRFRALGYCNVLVHEVRSFTELDTTAFRIHKTRNIGME